MAKEGLVVSWEDQKRICEFSVLAGVCQSKTTQLAALTRQLGTERDALRDLDMVLDEDEPIKYKCAHGFANVSYEEAMRLVREAAKKLEQQIAELRAELSQDEERAAILKRVLQSKFGDYIQLEF